MTFLLQYDIIQSVIRMPTRSFSSACGLVYPAPRLGLKPRLSSHFLNAIGHSKHVLRALHIDGVDGSMLYMKYIFSYVVDDISPFVNRIEFRLQ